jgi:hypothetical protein
MLMKMNEARMSWLQSTFGLQDGSQKRSQLQHSQITVISTPKHLPDIDMHDFAACKFREVGCREQRSDTIVVSSRAFNGIYCTL